MTAAPWRRRRAMADPAALPADHSTGGLVLHRGNAAATALFVRAASTRPGAQTKLLIIRILRRGIAAEIHNGPRVCPWRGRPNFLNLDLMSPAVAEVEEILKLLPYLELQGIQHGSGGVELLDGADGPEIIERLGCRVLPNGNPAPARRRLWEIK